MIHGFLSSTFFIICIICLKRACAIRKKFQAWPEQINRAGKKTKRSGDRRPQKFSSPRAFPPIFRPIKRKPAGARRLARKTENAPPGIDFFLLRVYAVCRAFFFTEPA
jgi:hypothetical protein